MKFTDEMYAHFNFELAKLFQTPYTIGNNMAHQVTSPLHCIDGFTMSVQASHSHYCYPRKSFYQEGSSENFYDNYTAFEVGFPSEVEPLLMEWVEDFERPTDTVYAGVPKAIIEEIIKRHGGLCRVIDQEV